MIIIIIIIIINDQRMASVEVGQGAIVCSEAIITGEVTIGDIMILILFIYGDYGDH